MKLNVKELKDITSFVADVVNAEACCAVPLFHGTRQYALEVTDEDRNRFYSACDKVISYAKKLFFDDVIDEDLLLEYQRTKNNMFLSTVVHQYKTSLYQYGDFYLTSSYSTAVSFSRNSGGEFGEWAYHQCIGFKDFNIALDKETEEATKVITEEYEKYHNSEKLVLVYCDINFEDLCTQRGEPFLIKNEEGKVDKYLMDVVIKNLYKCADTDTSIRQKTFRLANPDAYAAIVVREKDLKKGFSVFTKVSDVEKFIKGHKIDI